MGRMSATAIFTARRRFFRNLFLAVVTGLVGVAAVGVAAARAAAAAAARSWRSLHFQTVNDCNIFRPHDTCRCVVTPSFLMIATACSSGRTVGACIGLPWCWSL